MDIGKLSTAWSFSAIACHASSLHLGQSGLCAFGGRSGCDARGYSRHFTAECALLGGAGAANL